FFFSSRRRHTRFSRDWSSDVCSSDLADIEAILDWDAKAAPSYEISFTPARVIMQDFTGVPCVVDLAAMREAITRLGGDPDRVNQIGRASCRERAWIAGCARG